MSVMRSLIMNGSSICRGGGEGRGPQRLESGPGAARTLVLSARKSDAAEPAPTRARTCFPRILVTWKVFNAIPSLTVSFARVTCRGGSSALDRAAGTAARTFGVVWEMRTLMSSPPNAQAMSLRSPGKSAT